MHALLTVRLFNSMTMCMMPSLICRKWPLDKWREGYLLPTWAQKITCWHFDWMLQSSSGQKWRRCEHNSGLVLLLCFDVVLQTKSSMLSPSPRCVVSAAVSSCAHRHQGQVRGAASGWEAETRLTPAPSGEAAADITEAAGWVWALITKPAAEGEAAVQNGEGHLLSSFNYTHTHTHTHTHHPVVWLKTAAGWEED